MAAYLTVLTDVFEEESPPSEEVLVVTASDGVARIGVATVEEEFGKTTLNMIGTPDAKKGVATVTVNREDLLRALGVPPEIV